MNLGTTRKLKWWESITWMVYFFCTASLQLFSIQWNTIWRMAHVEIWWRLYMGTREWGRLCMSYNHFDLHVCGLKVRRLIQDTIKTKSANSPGRNANPPGQIVYSARADYSIIRPGEVLIRPGGLVYIPYRWHDYIYPLHPISFPVWNSLFYGVSVS